MCIQDLSTSAEVQMVMKDSTNEVEKIIYEDKGNDHKVRLRDSWNTSWCCWMHRTLYGTGTIENMASLLLCTLPVLYRDDLLTLFVSS